MLKIAVVNNPTNCLTPPTQGTFANIRINLISPETIVITKLAYIFVADSSTYMGLSSFKFLWWAPIPKDIFSAIECVSAVQSHPI